jgi:hypothetical protein
VPTVVVNDDPASSQSAGLAATVITTGRSEQAGGPAPDLRFVQTSPTTVRITTAQRRFDVAIVAFRQEQAWTG